jgi:hypothetical protein
MDEKEFREYLKKRDDETREDRVKRRSELSLVTYGELPKLLGEYSTEAIQLYICGHFASVILWCATILELALSDKLIHNSKGTKEVIELLTLSEKTRLCHKFGIITSKEDKNNIDDIRNLRNSIIHADAGQLAEMARAYYGDVDDVISQVLPELYLGDFGEALKSEALKSLTFTRELTKRWYGEKPSGFASGRD